MTLSYHMEVPWFNHSSIIGYLCYFRWFAIINNAVESFFVPKSCEHLIISSGYSLRSGNSGPKRISIFKKIPDRYEKLLGRKVV